ncbi:hypothetical protein O1611_g4868 [Lasiodiplodia mahajangana]|uniref:Uncharacterized protein n=1 Tax=Lasiodiplodia mahajangana TaxID=1108764 RepID=A0ACC2JMP1_9PEZI|nr:hypothetical protein O1611_g4868 [Lasiodiplodia mahajangana]
MDSREQYEDTPSQPFLDVLTELSAGLAILSVIQRQQEAPPGTISENPVRRFNSASESEFVDKIQVPLPDLLWAFSLLFSPSREWPHVVASVLREEPQNQFTLYLANNRGSRSPEEEEYSNKWQKAVNSDDKTDLWPELAGTCTKRLESYTGINTISADAISEQFCKEIRDFATRASPGEPTGFPSALMNLIEKDLVPKLGNKASSTPLADKCWQFLRDHGDQFNEMFAQLPRWPSYRDADLPLSAHPTQLTLLSFRKAIENLAKLPRALSIFNEFRDALVSKGARFEIKLIPAPDTNGAPGPSKAIKAIKTLTAPLEKSGLIASHKVKEAIGIASRQQDRKPHCEIQMVQYFDQNQAERAGTWNVMGSSKRPCFACASLLRCSDFLFKESHGKAYPQHFQPAVKWFENNPNMKSAIRALKEDVVMRINSYKRALKQEYEVPDSATFFY